MPLLVQKGAFVPITLEHYEMLSDSIAVYGSTVSTPACPVFCGGGGGGSPATHPIGLLGKRGQGI